VVVVLVADVVVVADADVVAVAPQAVVLVQPPRRGATRWAVTGQRSTSKSTSTEPDAESAEWLIPRRREA
jgi:hypothetical protein